MSIHLGTKRGWITLYIPLSHFLPPGICDVNVTSRLVRNTERRQLTSQFCNEVQLNPNYLCADVTMTQYSPPTSSPTSPLPSSIVIFCVRIERSSIFLLMTWLRCSNMTKMNMCNVSFFASHFMQRSSTLMHDHGVRLMMTMKMMMIVIIMITMIMIIVNQ